MDFSQYYAELQAIVTADFERAGFSSLGKKVLEFEEGSKLIRIVVKDEDHKGNRQQYGSAFGFIVKADDKFKLESGKFAKAGDLLKTATWRAPAKNFIRGNITDLKNARIRWTGVY